MYLDLKIKVEYNHFVKLRLILESLFFPIKLSLVPVFGEKEFPKSNYNEKQTKSHNATLGGV